MAQDMRYRILGAEDDSVAPAEYDVYESETTHTRR